MASETFTDIGILGAEGRMGQAIIRAVMDHPNAKLTVALGRAGSKNIGAAAGSSDVLISSDVKQALDQCDVLIDFSAPQAAIDTALSMYDHRCRTLVTGTTGFSDTESSALDAAADHITLLRSGNFSPGVTALAALVEIATEKLGTGWDIEVLEMHHRHKVDAPSGTALLLGEAAAKGRGLSLDESAVYAREGQTGKRGPDEIGFATLRGGGVIGQHEVRLASGLEMITLSHDAFDRSVFARGAVEAALWAEGQENGLYSMRDVLGF